MKRKHQSCRGNEHRSNLGVREVDGEEGGVGTPSSYVLREMEKTNIWPSAVERRPLNECAAGRQNRTLAIAAVSHQAKCDNLCVTPHLCLFLYILCIDGGSRETACVCFCLSVCMCFIFLDWSAGALLFSKLVTYFKASSWHDSAPTALRVTRGFIKACIWNSRGEKKNAVKVKTNKTGMQACQSITKW